MYLIYGLDIDNSMPKIPIFTGSGKTVFHVGRYFIGGTATADIFMLYLQPDLKDTDDTGYETDYGERCDEDGVLSSG